jgi:hypothetical protein
MRARCSNPNTIGWHRYGGRGISVDPRWDDFTVFFTDMGPRPGPKYTVDRIDGNGNYGPENCRWATRLEQAQNTSRVHLVTWDGQTRTIAEWARIAGINKDTIRGRLRRGLSPAEALTRPV